MHLSDFRSWFILAFHFKKGTPRGFAPVPFAKYRPAAKAALRAALAVHSVQFSRRGLFRPARRGAGLHTSPCLKDCRKITIRIYYISYFHKRHLFSRFLAFRTNLTYRFAALSRFSNILSEHSVNIFSSFAKKIQPPQGSTPPRRLPFSFVFLRDETGSVSR